MRIKNIVFIYLIFFNFTLSFETITELYIKTYLAKDIDTFSPEARLIIDENSMEDYELNLELIIDDDDSELDLARVKFYLDESDLELGRNRIGWGVGTNFNPSDIFNDKAFDSAFDPYYRKEGRDSIIYTKYFNNSNLQALYTFTQEKTILNMNDERSPDFAFKYKKNILDYDIELIFISKGEHLRYIGITEEADSIYGFNFKGDIPNSDFGIWNEMIYSEEENDIGAAFGIDLYFAEKFYFNLEYFRNYKGEDKKSEYDFTLLSLQENIGQNYLIPALKVEFTEKLSTYTYLMLNLDDNSLIIGDTMDYYYNDIISINFGLYYILGSEGSEYGYYSDEYGVINAGGSIKAEF